MLVYLKWAQSYNNSIPKKNLYFCDFPVGVRRGGSLVLPLDLCILQNLSALLMNSLPACFMYCSLLITFANSLVILDPV